MTTGLARLRASDGPARILRTVLALGLALMPLPAFADSTEITTQSGNLILHGTLETATDQHAAALILPGSGPTDRNGNSPFGVSADAYRLLAEGLAGEGISTARIDKRGIGESEGDPNAVTLDLYRSDHAAWIETVRAETDVDCVWLIGHSEGGIHALHAAHLDEVCGLILLTAPGRDIGALLIDQVAANPMSAGFVPALTHAIDALRTGDEPDVSALPAPLAVMFGPELRGFMADLLQANPADMLATTDLPVLILHGDADLQVPPSEVAPLSAARPEVEHHVLSGMTHMLKTAIALAEAEDMSSYAAASLATYAGPETPLHQDLLPLLRDFILTAR